MKGLKPIKVVEDLISHLLACPPQAEVMLMPDNGEPYPIGGVLAFNNENPSQVWILIDEFGETDQEMIEWSGGPSDEDEVDEGCERAGDMANALTEEVEKPKVDVVRVRGKLRIA